MRERATLIEFYKRRGAGQFAHTYGYTVPRATEYVSIKGETYLVERVTWALDYCGQMDERLRACVEVTTEDDRG